MLIDFNNFQKSALLNEFTKTSLQVKTLDNIFSLKIIAK